MTNPPKVLLIEDDASAAQALDQVLAGEGMDVATANRGDDGLKLAEQGTYDLVLTDFKMPGLNGLDLIKQLHKSKPRLPIILMTAHGTTETAIEATKLGAYDYLLKPFEMEELLTLLRKAISSSRLMTEPVEIQEGTPGRDAIVGNSRGMQAVYKEIGRVAAKPVNVLIRGETGTGKELVARALYQYSDRAKQAFIAVNCAAIPETLLESELFGHERGAFTGADARRIGRFEQASGGTLFLDEIGDLSLNTQAKLLRVLQEKCIQRLGGKETIPVDVRVLTATHRELEKAIQEKQFREDLYYRLSVVVINLPPLRQRPEDVSVLAKFFLQKYGSELGATAPAIQPEAIEWLQRQHWPGNVRQLENALRKALLQARGYTITIEDFQTILSANTTVPAPGQQPLSAYVSELLMAAKRGELDDALAKLTQSCEREIFGQAIALAKGNQAQAARWLGVSRLTMREKLLQFGLHPTQEAQNETN